MTTQGPVGTGGLQFERADFGGATTTTCAACARPVHDYYYEVNGHIACEACRVRLEAAPPGTRAGRVAKAAALGTLAAAAGTALYYAVSAITGYEFSLIAIVVGVFVGKAVRKGSGGRGGGAYQALAMFLTYASIVSAYIPPIVKQIASDAPHHATQKADVKAASAGVAAPVGAAAPADAQTRTATSTVPDPPPTLGRAVLGLFLAVVLLFALAMAAPFLAGVQNIVGLIIIAIGLYEAWKMNKRVAIVVNGPYRVGAGPSAPAAAQE
jgi:hypothetical protein